MAKEIETYVKLNVKGGQANPSPPIGPALGSKGVNIMQFCKAFNASTQHMMGEICPVLITVYIKTAPTSYLIMKASKATKGSAQPNRIKVGKVTWDQVKEIAEKKMPDLNCFTIESAMRMVAGTARSMGVTVEGTPPWA